MPLCWDGAATPFVCAEVLDEGLQKVLAIFKNHLAIFMHSEGSLNDKLFANPKPEGELLSFAFAARQAWRMELQSKWMCLGQLMQSYVVHEPNLGPLSQTTIYCLLESHRGPAEAARPFLCFLSLGFFLILRPGTEMGFQSVEGSTQAKTALASQ